MSEIATRALVIVDMQRGMTEQRTIRRNQPEAEDRMAMLLAGWRRAGQPIVHVRHMSRRPDSPFWPGQAGAEFDPRFVPAEGEHVMEKNVTDAFANSGLERWLRARAIGALAIVGVSTNMSVEATARSAGCLGFDTVVVADACFTFDTLDLAGTLRAAEEIHLISLTNLHGEYATVLDAATLVARTDWLTARA